MVPGRTSADARKAISHKPAVASAAPNFGYALCARAIPDEDIASLDLLGWRWALCGAEPVRAETVESFISRFKPAGFRAESSRPTVSLKQPCSYLDGGLNPVLRWRTRWRGIPWAPGSRFQPPEMQREPGWSVAAMPASRWRSSTPRQACPCRRPVRVEGFEPSANRLKVYCSTTELHPRRFR